MVENCVAKVSGYLWDFKQKLFVMNRKLKCKELLCRIDKCKYLWQSFLYFIKILLIGIWNILCFDVTDLSGKDITSNFSRGS